MAGTAAGEQAVESARLAPLGADGVGDVTSARVQAELDSALSQISAAERTSARAE